MHTNSTLDEQINGPCSSLSPMHGLTLRGAFDSTAYICCKCNCPVMEAGHPSTMHCAALEFHHRLRTYRPPAHPRRSEACSMHGASHPTPTRAYGRTGAHQVLLYLGAVVSSTQGVNASAGHSHRRMAGNRMHPVSGSMIGLSARIGAATGPQRIRLHAEPHELQPPRACPAKLW